MIFICLNRVLLPDSPAPSKSIFMTLLLISSYFFSAAVRRSSCIASGCDVHAPILTVTEVELLVAIALLCALQTSILFYYTRW